jgi:hypothetical protein
LFAGFAIGGFIAMPVIVITASTVSNTINRNPAYVFIFVYVLGALLGAFALWRIRLHLDFVTGFIGGAAAGLLGLGALCNVILGGLGNMH